MLYVLAGNVAATPTSVTPDTVQPAASISEADAEEVYKKEGAEAMRGWREVEPILIRTCGSLKCHNAANTQAKWTLVTTEPLDKKTLAQNFKTVDKYIKRGDDIATSPLLEKPLKGKDAGHPEIIFRSPTDPVYTRTSKWLGTLKTATASIWGNASSAPPPPPPTPAPGAGTK
jgi:hypothetical protein